jgi:hypothetical protein
MLIAIALASFITMEDIVVTIETANKILQLKKRGTGGKVQPW